jgi:hypothetical protein
VRELKSKEWEGERGERERAVGEIRKDRGRGEK